MKVLVKFDANWADEFDVTGFKIYDSESKFLKDRGDTAKLTYCFGTNEQFEEGDIEDDNFTIREITNEEAFILENLFGNEYGNFTL